MSNHIIASSKALCRHSWLALRSRTHGLVKSDFVQQIAATFVTKIALIIVGLITGVLIARALGPEGRGLYAVAVTIASTGIQFGNLGLHASNTYTVAKSPSMLPYVVGNSFFVSFIGAVASAAAWTIFYFIPSLAPVQGGLLALSLIWIPFGLAYLLLQNILLGIHDVRSFNTIELVTQITGLALIGLIILVKAVNVELIYGATLTTLVIGISWSYLAIKRRLDVKQPALSLSLFKENLRFGMKAYTAAFFSFLVLRIDLLMVKHLLNAEQAGYYSIAVNMADMIYILPVVIGTLLFPKLTILATNREKWFVARKVAIAVAILMVIFGICASFLAKPTVNLLFGKSYFPSIPAFIWLMPGIILLSVNTIFMNFFASTGMPIITVYSPGAAALLNIALNFKFIPLWGILGASISSVIAYGFMFCCSLFFIFRSGVRSYEQRL